MAKYGYMTHDDPAPPVARTPADRLAACGYVGGWGENIAFGYTTARPSSPAGSGLRAIARTSSSRRSSPPGSRRRSRRTASSTGRRSSARPSTTGCRRSRRPTRRRRATTTTTTTTTTTPPPASAGAAPEAGGRRSRAPPALGRPAVRAALPRRRRDDDAAGGVQRPCRLAAGSRGRRLSRTVTRAARSSCRAPRGDATSPARRGHRGGPDGAPFVLPRRPLISPGQRFVIGTRRSRPNAFGRSFTPGGACRRLYSARSTSASARSTTSGSKPSWRELVARAVELDVGLEDPVERRVRRERVLVALVGAQLGATARARSSTAGSARGRRAR